MLLQNIDLKIPTIIKEVEAALQISLEVGARNNQLNRTFINAENTEEVLADGKFFSTLENPVSNNKNYFFDEYVLAGGAFSGLYMDQYTDYTHVHKHKEHPFKDVDIFVRYDLFDREIFKRYLPEEAVILAEDSWDPRYSDIFDLLSITKFAYKGVDFELVTVNSMIKVHTFDFRFRNFYYKRGKSFATKNAIQDITEKKLIASSFHSAGTSYVRGLIFEKQFGFEMDSITKEMLIWSMSNRKTNQKNIYSYLEAKQGILEEERDEIKNNLGAIFEGNIESSSGTFHNPELKFPLHENVRGIISCMNTSFWTEEIFEYMKNYVDIHELNGITFQRENPFDISTSWSELNEKFYVLLRANMFEALFQNSNSVFIKYDSLDFETLNTFFNEFSFQKQVDMLREWDINDDIIIQLDKWFLELKDDSTLETVVGNFIDKINNYRIKYKISIENQNTIGALLNNSLEVQVTHQLSYHQAYYEFAKTNRDIFTLSRTNAAQESFYSEESLNNIIAVMKEEYPTLFDYGVNGETAPLYNDYYSSGSYFFERVENEKDLVLNLTKTK